MKRILSIMLLSLGLNMAYADDFKVLLVNDASLKYKNGKTVKVGDVFKSAEDINWQKDKQAVKAYNMTTKKQVIFLGMKYVRKTGSKAMINQKFLSTHNPGDTIQAQLASVFADEYILLDSVMVATNVDLNEKRYFLATYEYGDAKITKRLSHEKDMVIIDKSLFKFDDQKLKPRDIRLSIDFVDKQEGRIAIPIKDIDLFVVPLKLGKIKNRHK